MIKANSVIPSAIGSSVLPSSDFWLRTLAAIPSKKSVNKEMNKIDRKYVCKPFL
jgi:hypothetical protein